MITVGITLLLACGFLAGKICQRIGLPAVTGYILAGLLLGPTGFGLITAETIGHSLDHFTSIALMLIAFGIGEHIELRKLKAHTKSLLWIGLCETTGSLVAVSCVVYFTIFITQFQVEGWTGKDYLALSMLLGAVGVATAPAATLLVIRELRARGPLTSTLMAIVAIDDGLAIMLFGLVVSATHQLLGHSGAPLLLSIFAGLFEIGGSLILGILTGYILIVLLNYLKESGEIMTAGLATLLMCSELALYLHFSPLLAGMAAGFIMVNMADRDVRIFRELNKFEPPIYVLFFTLAGTHLDLDSLKTSGIIGLVYFFARIGGKIGGVALGARIAGSLPKVRKYLGYALLPQAGVAIGLIFLLSSDPKLVPYTTIITPVVLAGVFLSELIGPVSARYALAKAGEQREGRIETQEAAGENGVAKDFSIIPWTWKKLKPPTHPQGFVVFHGEDPVTSRGLARTATILASFFRAQPMAVQVQPPNEQLPPRLFREEYEEVLSMGYSLTTELVPDPDLASGLVTAVEYNEAKAVVLAYPLLQKQERFKKLLHTVARHVHCPVAVIRFCGELHTERILILVTDLQELAYMFRILQALDSIGEHRLHLLYMMSSTATSADAARKTEQLNHWLKEKKSSLKVRVEAIPTASRLEIIEEAAKSADLVVMRAVETGGVQKILFGSLVDSLARRLNKTLMIIYNPEKDTDYHSGA